ncbi:uncharacterized protein LOC143460658 isoform X1 [Clavelina lepadiformis]|uniref:uncharacterized protein LOC143460658 isoform X1 n=1 Tax=Clavelina lepadiformis TaxID=159417 RepID=UPI0040424BE3
MSSSSSSQVVDKRSSKPTNRRKNSTPRKNKTPISQSSNSKISQERTRRRCRPGQKALKEIRHAQRSTELCIRKLAFSRLVREIQYRINPRITHWQLNSIACLQEAAEAYLIRYLEDCNEAAVFAQRVTLMQKDLQFIGRLRGKNGDY